jgi:transcriptional regulator with XRE-family HTH domain
VLQLDELLDADLEAATTAACEALPDLVAALDVLMPRVLAGGDRAVVRRYAAHIDAAAEALSTLTATDSSGPPPPTVVFHLLRRDATEVPWVAPSLDGRGAMTVLVDRLRGITAGLPRQCTRTRHDIDLPRFTWFVTTIDEIEQERRCSSPLRRAMEILELTSGEVARLMGVSRQAVEKWLLAGPPADRLPKIGALAEIAETLRHRLRPGLPAVVARRPAPAYGDRSMLQLIEADEHEWLRRSIAESFDLTNVA